jgi:hypothetical protein
MHGTPIYVWDKREGRGEEAVIRGIPTRRPKKESWN